MSSVQPGISYLSLFSIQGGYSRFQVKSAGAQNEHVDINASHISHCATAQTSAFGRIENPSEKDGLAKSMLGKRKCYSRSVSEYRQRFIAWQFVGHRDVC